MSNAPDPLKLIATWPQVAEKIAIESGIPRDAKFWEEVAQCMAAWAHNHVVEHVA